MIFNNTDKFINNKYVDTFGKHSHAKYKSLNMDACLCHRHVFTM